MNLPLQSSNDAGRPHKRSQGEKKKKNNKNNNNNLQRKQWYLLGIGTQIGKKES